jgi:hypothetical protein
MIKNVEKMYSLTSPIVFVKTYKVTLNNDTVIYVPLDPANSDYQAIQEWIKEGGTVIDNPPQENN